MNVAFDMETGYAIPSYSVEILDLLGCWIVVSSYCDKARIVREARGWIKHLGDPRRVKIS